MVGGGKGINNIAGHKFDADETTSKRGVCETEAQDGQVGFIQVIYIYIYKFILDNPGLFQITHICLVDLV